jgi:hypothetical protein
MAKATTKTDVHDHGAIGELHQGGAQCWASAVLDEVISLNFHNYFSLEKCDVV